MNQHADKLWFGHPRGVFLVAFTELWERFSYYGISALLVLYLTADPSEGGWGWLRGDAILFFAFYTGIVFVVPVFGGWMANNYLGERKCILAGASLLMVGHLLLGGPAFIPPVVEAFTGLDTEAVIGASGIPQGRVWALREIGEAFGVLAAAQESSPVAAAWLRTVAVWVYATSSASFLAGLVCVIVATGLFKAPIASIIGKLYGEAGARRDAGYAMFFTGIYLGAVLANFAAGGVGEHYGWHLGFATAAVGAAIALTAYLWKEKEFLGDIGRVPDGVRAATASEAAPVLTPEERDRLRVLILQGIFTTIYAAGFYQKGGLLTLYTRDYLDRDVGGFAVPATWFLSISTVTFMIAAPLLAMAYATLERSGRNPNTSYKLAMGLGVLGIAYVLLGSAEGARVLTGETAIGPLWLIGSYVLFGIGDVLVWPNQMALASRLAPGRYATLTVGAWQLTVGLGTWLAGLIGMAVDTAGNLQVFWGLAALCLGAGSLVAILTPRMVAMMHDGPRPPSGTPAALVGAQGKMQGSL